MSLEEYKTEKYHNILKWVNSHVGLGEKKPINCSELIQVCNSMYQTEAYEYMYETEKLASVETFGFFIDVLKDIAFSNELNTCLSISFYSDFQKFKIIRSYET